MTIEPGVGGRVYSTSRDHPGEISVVFAPNGGACHVRFAHGGWNKFNVSDRRKFSDWPVMLDRFAALANQASD